MKVLNKLLMATTMVVALGTTASCGNKQNTYFSGLPYTYIQIGYLDEGEHTFGLDYEGGDDVEIFWDSDEPSKEKTHTFIESGERSFYKDILIKGNVTSLWFCDKDGIPIGKDNDKIVEVILSNTITSIPERAYYTLNNLEVLFIPGSVQNIGKYAFVPGRNCTTFCEPTSRPSSWNDDWIFYPIMEDHTKWGVGYYIFEDGQSYVTYTDNDSQVASYCGFLFPSESTELAIPKTVNIKDHEFDVTSITSIGYADYLVSVTIPNSVVYIDTCAFSWHHNLTTIKFDGDFSCLMVSDRIFEGCDNLKNVVLPNGLINLSYDMFAGCPNLEEVTIPSSVAVILDNVFNYACSASKKLTIDVTGYKNPNDIAWCYDYAFDNLENVESVTFKYDNSVKPEDFIICGWPSEEDIFHYVSNQ